jgi:hypothetical protein
MHNRIRVACLSLAVSVCWVLSASAQVALEIRDSLAVPITGSVEGTGSNDVLLSRVNTLREEMGGEVPTPSAGDGMIRAVVEAIGF